MAVQWPLKLDGSTASSTPVNWNIVTRAGKGRIINSAEHDDSLISIREALNELKAAMASYGSDLSEDLTYLGGTTYGVVGEAVAFGDILYRNLTTGKWWKAQANAVGTVPGLRMALATAFADAPCLFLLPGGIVRNDAWAFTADGSVIELWLSSLTAGAIVETPVTTTGKFGQVVGTPLASNQMEFMPVLPVARY